MRGVDGVGHVGTVSSAQKHDPAGAVDVRHLELNRTTNQCQDAWIALGSSQGERVTTTVGDLTKRVPHDAERAKLGTADTEAKNDAEILQACTRQS